MFLNQTENVNVDKSVESISNNMTENILKSDSVQLL